MAATRNGVPMGDWLLNAVHQTQANVGTTPTALPTTALTNRRLLIVYNNSGGDIYLGDATVTTANGFKLVDKGSFTISLDENVILYGIASAAGKDVRVFEGA